MDDIFKLRGTLKSAAGKALPDLLVAILDEDDLEDDDLIAVGTTDGAGAFRLSFLRSEFSQDALEYELTPDIKVVVSTMKDGTFKAIFQRSFADLNWDKREVDLGDIVLTGVNVDAPAPLAGVEAIPGVTRRVAHLDIDSDLVRHCMAEVAPIVEHLTGWPKLLDGLKFEAAPTLAPYLLRESLVGAGKDPTGFGAKVQESLMDVVQGPGAGCALYDAHIHTVVINTSVMEQVNLEGLKVICGHELVHVGQFKYTPGLREYNLDHLRGMIVRGQTEGADIAAKRMAYMTELEGYAKYIESDFLQGKLYRMAMLVYNPSITEKLFDAVLRALMGGDGADKTAQYTDGREIYRKRQQGDVPARFSLNVSTLFGAAPAATAANK